MKGNVLGAIVDFLQWMAIAILFGLAHKKGNT